MTNPRTSKERDVEEASVVRITLMRKVPLPSLQVKREDGKVAVPRLTSATATIRTAGLLTALMF